ncbi:hypothetical protein N0V91_007190 [Didymella pomorum]|uniref:Uncharacterized protein n=1 Tax=Didymella pomorum TaxID=749634 RepID=A0A9W8Z9J9_9PLEO|nr:hypothetical protein N0V91_007190 [Didymella pomorum]
MAQYASFDQAWTVQICAINHWFLLTCNNNEHIYLEDNEEKADNDEEEEGFGEAEEEEGFDGEKEEQNEDGSAYNDLEVEEDTLGGMTGAVEHLRDRETAAVLVSTLYHELRDTAGNASDLEVKTMLDQALLYADLHASVPFPDTLWTQMRGMVKRMPRDSKHADWDDKVEHDWIQRLKRALKLTLVKQKIEGQDRPEVQKEGAGDICSHLRAAWRGMYLCPVT